MNRKWMPKADTSTWTPLEYIAEQVEEFNFENKNKNLFYFQFIL